MSTTELLRGPLITQADIACITRRVERILEEWDPKVPSTKNPDHELEILRDLLFIFDDYRYPRSVRKYIGKLWLRVVEQSQKFAEHSVHTPVRLLSGRIDCIPDEDPLGESEGTIARYLSLLAATETEGHPANLLPMARLLHERWSVDRDDMPWDLLPEPRKIGWCVAAGIFPVDRNPDLYFSVGGDGSIVRAILEHPSPAPGPTSRG